MYWIAIFSQTGSEIVNLSDTISRVPDLILTNNMDETTYCDGLKSSKYKIKQLSHKDLVKYLVKLKRDPKTILITLHGYLRILPSEVCDKFPHVYNGHPAPIHKYPDLRGKDVQGRMFTEKEKYPDVGSVIHRVIAEVDAGDIILTSTGTNNFTSVDDAYSKLKLVSLNTWKIFFYYHVPRLDFGDVE